MGKVMLKKKINNSEVLELVKANQGEIQDISINTKQQLIITSKVAKYNVLLKDEGIVSSINLKFSGWTSKYIIFLLITIVLCFVGFIGVIPLIIILIIYSKDLKKIATYVSQLIQLS